MTQTPLASALTDITAPLAASLGLELWGIELAFGGRGLVRVFVESENGVSIDQCAELSRLLSLSLDVEDLLPGAYVLEVSSPGLERTFFTEAQLARAVGQRVEITLHQPHAAWPGRRKFRGPLQQAPASISHEDKEGTPEPASSAPPAEATDGTGLFTLRAEELARPGEEDPLVSFTFADLKKAVQIHFFSEQPLPGKPAGKKNSKKNAAKEHGGAAATEHDPDTQDGDTHKKQRPSTADISRDAPGGKTKRGSDTEL